MQISGNFEDEHDFSKLIFQRISDELAAFSLLVIHRWQVMFKLIKLQVIKKWRSPLNDILLICFHTYR